MPKGPNGETRPADVVGCAVHVGRIAIGEIEDDREDRPPRQPMKAKGGRKGGPARAAALTPERRKEIAQAAAAARWAAAE